MEPKGTQEDKMSTEQTNSTPAPERSGVTPYLSVDGAAKAAETYKKAFGAQEVYSVAPDEQGRTMHIHLVINGGSVMLCDFYPEHGHAPEKPAAFNLHIQVDDPDRWFQRAAAAGLDVRMPLQDMFWGDRYGQLVDAYGVVWAIGGPAKAG